MEPSAVLSLLQQVRGGKVTTEEALERLKSLPFAALASATLDTHRALRTGAPEVVFGEGKAIPQLLDIAATLLAEGGNLLVTRVDGEKGSALARAFPAGVHDLLSRTFRIGELSRDTRRGKIVVVTAGTSDAPVAAETFVTARFLGNAVDRIDDVGVAGLHRIAACRETLDAAAVIIVIAGMEGALASVVAGLVSRPVIAVPTSVGYGASFGGLAALLAMLSSCAAGVGVVNIDNGFGAAVLASSINRA